MVIPEIIISRGTGYSTDIIELWRECLPGTPEERFHWMNGSNPVGQAIWFLALDRISHRIIGTTSLVPKILFTGEERLRGAIVGDIMVKKEYRHHGIALQLQHAILDKMMELEFYFFYVIPNEKSRGVVSKAGYRRSNGFRTLVLPVDLSHYIHSNSFIFTKMVLPFIDKIMLSAAKTFLTKRIYIEEITLFDDSFDFTRPIRNNRISTVTSDHNSTYLNWRFMQNTTKDYRVILIRTAKCAGFLGYVIFAICDDRRLAIYDIVLQDTHLLKVVLSRLYCIAREMKCYGIYIGLSDNNPLLLWLKLNLFLDTGDKADIYVYGDKLAQTPKWAFFSGDRNL